MAKFCKCCGLPYKNYAYKCVECGVILQKKKKTPMQIAIIVISIVLSVCLVASTVAYLIYDHITSPETRAGEIVEYFMDGDLDAVMDSIPKFLWEYEAVDEHKLRLEMSVQVNVQSEYIYSFNTNREITPSERQVEELIDSIKQLAGEDFDSSVIQDIKFVWIDIRGGLTNFWQESDVRFAMIKYQDEWCWWPYY